MEFIQEIKIPLERVPILIGKKGNIKRELQEKLNLKIKINSQSGIVEVIGDDGLNIHNGIVIIKAIARGFNPEIALLLLDDDYIFEQIDIFEYSRGSKDRLYELKSRLIGTEGKAKKTLENIANVHICVYGKTVSIIGLYKNVESAKKAILKLIGGSKHGKAYYFLEKQVKEN